MDSFNLGDVFTVIFGRPKSQLQSACSTIRDVLVVCCVIVFIPCVHFYSNDYLDCNAVVGKTVADSLNSTTSYTPNGGSVKPTSVYTNPEDNTPVEKKSYTNECKKQDEAWWPVNFPHLFYSYLLIMFIVRRALDHALNIRKMEVLKTVAAMDHQDAINLLKTAMNLLKTPVDNLMKNPVIVFIETEIEAKRISFFAHDVVRILPGLVGDMIVIGLLWHFYWCYRFNLFAYCGGFVNYFVCDNPGRAFRNMEAFVKCGFDVDRLSNLLYCFGTASCYVVVDAILAVVDLTQKWCLWRSLGKQVEISSYREVSSYESVAQEPLETVDSDSNPLESSGVDMSKDDALVVMNLGYIVGCRRDGPPYFTLPEVASVASNTLREAREDENADDCSTTNDLDDNDFAIREAPSSLIASANVEPAQNFGDAGPTVSPDVVVTTTPLNEEVSGQAGGPLTMKYPDTVPYAKTHPGQTIDALTPNGQKETEL